MLQTNQIYLGDCLEKMQEIDDKSVDLILCDLPYGTTNCKWDTIIPFEPLWAQYDRICKENAAVVLFCSQPFTSALIMSNPKHFKYEWIWIKNQPSGFALANKIPMKYHENIVVFCNGKTPYNKQPSKRWSEKAKSVVKNGVRGKHHTVENGAQLNVPDVRYYDPENVNPKSLLDFHCVPNGGGGRLHPTQKPVNLLEYLIKTYTQENDLILDNCFGSGSTFVAAKNLNRQFIGIEKEEKYFNIAKERLNLC